jgi:hypothetical protein
LPASELLQAAHPTEIIHLKMETGLLMFAWIDSIWYDTICSNSKIEL